MLKLQVIEFNRNILRIYYITMTAMSHFCATARVRTKMGIRFVVMAIGIKGRIDKKGGSFTAPFACMQTVVLPVQYHVVLFIFGAHQQ